MGAPSLGEGLEGRAYATVVPRSLVRPWVSWMELEPLAVACASVAEAVGVVSIVKMTTLADVHFHWLFWGWVWHVPLLNVGHLYPGWRWNSLQLQVRPFQ